MNNISFDHLSLVFLLADLRQIEARREIQEQIPAMGEVKCIVERIWKNNMTSEDGQNSK